MQNQLALAHLRLVMLAPMHQYKQAGGWGNQLSPRFSGPLQLSRYKGRSSSAWPGGEVIVIS